MQGLRIGYQPWQITISLSKLDMSARSSVMAGGYMRIRTNNLNFPQLWCEWCRIFSQWVICSHSPPKYFLWPCLSSPTRCTFRWVYICALEQLQRRIFYDLFCTWYNQVFHHQFPGVFHPYPSPGQRTWFLRKEGMKGRSKLRKHILCPKGEPEKTSH